MRSGSRQSIAGARAGGRGNQVPGATNCARRGAARARGARGALVGLPLGRAAQRGRALRLLDLLRRRRRPPRRSARAHLRCLHAGARRRGRARAGAPAAAIYLSPAAGVAARAVHRAALPRALAALAAGQRRPLARHHAAARARDRAAANRAPARPAGVVPARMAGMVIQERAPSSRGCGPIPHP